MVVSMAMETQTHLIEAMLTEVLARLPLRSIARFKTVCKTWKTTLESTYFRRLFVSAHRNSSSSWSLVFVSKEIIGFHGCETWDLPKSPASFIPPSLKRFIFGYLSYAASSTTRKRCISVFLKKIPKDSLHHHRLNCLRRHHHNSFDCCCRSPTYAIIVTPSTAVAAHTPPSRPLRALHQHHHTPPSRPPSTPQSTPPPPHRKLARLKIDSVQSTNNDLACIWRVFIYSSEIGIWSFKKIYSPHHIQNMYYYITLNGTIYISCVSVHGVVLLSHDFYSESNEFRVVKLPEYQSDKKGIRRSLTTSGGFIIFGGYDESWKLLWVIKLPSISVYVPMAMHPFDIGTVYLCSHHDRHLVSCNLRTLNYTILKDGCQDCFIDQSVCDSFVNGVSDPRSSSYWWNGVSVKFLPLVLPRWMGSVPCPPQAEMIDTILVRLPLRSIARFKTVCKTWKTTLESTYFRRLFVSVHRNSSSSWSLLLCGTKEIIGFHGCETWDLPKSPAYFIPPSLKQSYSAYFSYAASSSGLVLINDSSYSDESYCYVGNPVLKQWIRIPPAPSYSIVLGLVTRVDEDGVLSSFKVIRLASIGIWSFKEIYCPHHIQNMYYYITLNGTIYISCVSVHGVVLLSHDFYSESNEFRVVKLPEYQSDKKGFTRSLTTS
ncbi:hypothetical protein HID58_045588 [Brassica napus]|uniref:F-box domain-containing protein n=2 Tax=Brassica napus TaxID=3708 RepID=A0ABQ8AVH4_BRANA|nr:hypothetical protein HID58_045588 [Brassica napus]